MTGLFQASIYFNHPILFYVACSGALVYSIGQATNMLLPSLIAFHLNLSSIEYSKIETAWSVGALGVSVSLAILKTKMVRPLSFELIIISAMSLVLGFVPFASRLPVLVAMHLLLGAAFAFVRIRMETRFLQECPVHLLGRFRANSMALTSLVGILVYFAPLINRKASIAVLYLSVASALLFVTVIVFAASASITSVGGRAIRE
ncbi:hypothetical protein [Caballeronia sp. BR00000012568055]|uniref:hypothetical protein n=1 Tax=Caballeronia sp. BR00000012568055 TaxID=2918761 RepID=UPI0023F76297|nr:hypothetical protein [Caballeronia sp. BR00000012568055]